jgi:proliferating cell nuclear antigen PCNA
MFEARLTEGAQFKNVIEAIKELLTDTNMDCTEDEMTIQAMDSAHVSLVAVSLKSSEFETYRCDRTLSLGMNTANMSKIFKMMGKDDALVLKAEDEGDNLTIMFESANDSSTIADFGTNHHSLSFFFVVFLSLCCCCCCCCCPFSYFNSHDAHAHILSLMFFKKTLFI